MRKFLAAAAVAFTLAMPAFADDAVAPERLALAKQVMELSGATKVYDNFDKTMDMVIGQMLQNTPNVDQTVVADIKKMAVEEFTKAKPDLMEGSAKIYARHFTEDDLRALIAFYKSDAGQHFAAQLPAVSQECVQLNVPFTKHFMDRIKQYIADKVAAKAAKAPEKSKDK